MLPYWLLFLAPAWAAVVERSSDPSRRRFGVAWLLIWSLLTLLIGFRYQVGGDWGNYLGRFAHTSDLSFDEALLLGDPAYNLLSWMAGKAGYDIVVVNVVCAAVFACGLVSFARGQPRPWLALTVAIPYLVTVVAMGYTRQSVAVSFAMLALGGLAANSTLRFALWVCAAALFHKTAVLLVPLAVLSKTTGRVWTTVWTGALGTLLFYFFLADDFDKLIDTYVDSEIQSEGALIRVMMNALPAAIFLLYRRNFELEASQLKLWTYMSYGALLFLVLLFATQSSTAIDRMALYLIPLQIFVLSRLPLAWHKRYGTGAIVHLCVIAYSASVQFVWLNFATHALYWLPYRIVFLAD